MSVCLTEELRANSDSANHSGRDGTTMEEWDVREWGEGQPRDGRRGRGITDNRSHKSLKKQAFWFTLKPTAITKEGLSGDWR